MDSCYTKGIIIACVHIEKGPVSTAYSLKFLRVKSFCRFTNFVNRTFHRLQNCFAG